MKMIAVLFFLSLSAHAATNYKNCIPRPEGAGAAREYELTKEGSLALPKELGELVSKSMSASLDKIVVKAKDRAPGTHVFELHKVDGRPVKLVHTSPLFGDKNASKSIHTRLFGYDRQDNCVVEDIEVTYNDGKDANKRLVVYQDQPCAQFVKDFKEKKATSCAQNYMANCLDVAPEACIENPSLSCAAAAKDSCQKRMSSDCSLEAKKLDKIFSGWDKNLRSQNRFLFGFNEQEQYVLEDPFSLAMNIANSCRYYKDFYSPERKPWQVWRAFRPDHAKGYDEGEDDYDPSNSQDSR